MTAEQLSLYAGVLVSLLFGYLPWLSKWYEALASEYKKLVMAGSLLIVAVAILVFACTGYGSLFGIPIVCDQTGFAEVIKIFVAALISNQATYLITKK